MIESQNNKKVVQNILQSLEIKDKNDIGDKLSDFEILQVLGVGRFSFVAKVKSKKNFKIYAMKKYDLSLIDDDDYKKYYENENIFMQNLNHPNVCKLYNTFGDDNNLYMIMEFMNNGNLSTFINANMKLGKRIKEDKLWNIFEQCLKGLVYIHSLGLIHRDIKPENILLNDEGQIKLIDFNLSALENIIKANNFTNNSRKKKELVNRNTIIELGNFQAPEVGGSYDYKIDVYSMGIVFCFLAFYKTELPPELYNNQYYSNELIDIILKMTDSDRNERPSSLEIYNYFLKAYVEKNMCSTGLISCINCISLYEETFINLFKKKVKKIEPSNKVSILLESIIKKKEEEINFNFSLNDYDPEYKSLDHYIIEFRELLYKYGIKKNKDMSNEIEPIFIINFILKKLHEELNNKKDMYGKFYYSESVEKNNIKQDRYENFINFYNSNFNSIISDNFFGLMKTKRTCKKCHNSDYLFNTFCFIPFNIQNLINNFQGKNEINLYDAFDCLNQKNHIDLDKNKYAKCIFCGDEFREQNEFKQFFNLPKNLIIFFDRGKKNIYKNVINFPKNLILNKKYVESFKSYMFYKLLGVICRIENKNKNNSSKTEIKYISYKAISDDCYINFEKNQQNNLYNLAQIKKMGDIIALFYFCSYAKPNIIIDNSLKNININDIINKYRNYSMDKGNISGELNMNFQNNNYVPISSQSINNFNNLNMNNQKSVDYINMNI